MSQVYDKWNEVKKQVNCKNRNLSIKVREIFWVKIGQNIGDEEYGKGEIFSRPVLVIRDFTKDLFLGVPLTTSIKNNDYFHHFEFNTKKGSSSNSAMLLQLKAFSKKELQIKLVK
ncbi:MAG: type II toxin-antitoxin system PemK/MazF family toxin [Sulfurospirillum sp.]|nr:type II toxin-antitoxin system PemK/MazF family toxin [Sulfurospirillum sp.]MBL0702678.1 type II toxin-antitoxin system PemK/MazF family toxin [Sulfurospirillum sp.]